MTDAQHEETARRPTGWPSDKPVWTITVFLLAALVVPGRIAFEYARHWNGLKSSRPFFSNTISRTPIPLPAL